MRGGLRGGEVVDEDAGALRERQERVAEDRNLGVGGELGKPILHHPAHDSLGQRLRFRNHILRRLFLFILFRHRSLSLSLSPPPSQTAALCSLSAVDDGICGVRELQLFQFFIIIIFPPSAVML